MTLRRALVPLAAPAASLCIALATGLATAPSAGALSLRTCSSDSDFACGSLRVPLDRSGALRGTLALRVAVQRDRPRGGGLLVALSGGPGQSSVSAAGSFADAVWPLLHRYRLAVIDQRGTGAGALSCPVFQRLGALDPYTPEAVRECAQRVGPRRSNYATIDTVDDLEALRRAFGVPKLALYGISYGTWVAQEYARRYPRRVDRLILDSVVGPDSNDAFFLDTYRRMPRILREQCRGRRCAGATSDPVGDLGAVAAQLARGPLRGTRYTATGAARRTSLSSEEQLAYLVVAGDVNPFLRARLPGVLAAAARGDAAPLLRTRRIAEGLPSSPRDFSSALNLVTGCLDARLPFGLSTPLPERPALVEHAFAAILPRDYDPWSADAVLRSAYADDCLLFPRQADVRRIQRPLPDVPVMILSGRLDMRTPAENGRLAARRLPRARVVELPGNGHDQIDSDITGCAALALKRWVDRRRLGAPCKGTDNQVTVLPRPPRSLSEVGPSRQVPGRRGRVALAALATAAEVRYAAYEAAFAGFGPSGGGLRGGSFAASDPFEGTVRLRGYAYVPGVRLTGTLRFSRSGERGAVRVSGLVSGRLQVDTRSGVTGVLGGRAIRLRRSPRRARAALAGAADLPPIALFASRGLYERRLRAALDAARFVP